MISASGQRVAFGVEELLPVGDVLPDQPDALHEGGPARDSGRNDGEVRVLVSQNPKHHYRYPPRLAGRLLSSCSPHRAPRHRLCIMSDWGRGIAGAAPTGRASY